LTRLLFSHRTNTSHSGHARKRGQCLIEYHGNERNFGTLVDSTPGPDVTNSGRTEPSGERKSRTRENTQTSRVELKAGLALQGLDSRTTGLWTRALRVSQERVLKFSAPNSPWSVPLDIWPLLYYSVAYRTVYTVPHPHLRDRTVHAARGEY
jgi:hypothetical protein